MDITVAFMCRKPQHISACYLHHLLSCEELPGWRFSDITGCPIAFVASMARLAVLASMYQNAAAMDWTVFDDLTFKPELLKIRESIKTERPFLCSRETGDVNQRPDFHQNRYHCVEAWRKAILLYTYRIFDREVFANAPAMIANLAHGTIDHVRWIAQSDDIQRQVLIPMFLAGAEMRTKGNRDFVRNYCMHWSALPGFRQFQIVLELLEDIWQQSDLTPGIAFCWANRVSPRDWLSVISGCGVLTSDVPT
jgi:hypothetical protein